MKLKRNLITGQADAIADGKLAGSRHRALDGAVRLDQALKANPDAARKLGNVNGRGKPLSVPPAWVDAAARDGIDTTWTPQMRAWSDYVRRGKESRDLSAGAATGQYLVPQGGFLSDVLFGIRFSSSISGRCRVIETPHGYPMTVPTLLSEPSTNASQIGENTQSLDTNDPNPFGRVVFSECPIYNLPGLWRLSRNLVADAAVDVESMLTEAMAWRVSRQTDADFLTSALAGVTQTSTAASQTALVYQDIVNLIYSLDLAARGSQSAALIVSPATAKALASLQDSSLRPLLVDSTYTFVSDNADQFGSQQSRTVRVKTIEGIPVLEAKSLPAALTAGATVGIFADWDQAFLMRFVDCGITPLFERFADYGQIAWNGWIRIDGQVADPNAAVKLVMHA
jgi:HK97 family phage major capsid protein